MQNIDSQFINLIKSKSSKNISFIEEVAQALETNYDAAYRRINGKTTISLSDAVKLSKYYNVSLNKMFTVGDSSKILVKRITEISSIKNLEMYFNNVSKNLKKATSNNAASMIYTAKELPVYYSLQNPELLKFKIYVWLQVLGKDKYVHKTPYNEFRIPESLVEIAAKVGEQYKNITITEMWSSNIINTVLHQIQYFFEANLLSHRTALLICEELKNVVSAIEEDSHTGNRNNPNKTKFQIYYNPLLNSNNNVLIKTPTSKKLFLSYSILAYYEIDDVTTCNNMDKHLKEQLILSKQITESGVKDIILFFKPLYRQIDSLVKQINLLKQFPIQKF